jgi:Ni,Fe-hydrogenase III large subunit
MIDTPNSQIPRPETAGSALLSPLWIRNATAVRRADVPSIPLADFRRISIDACSRAARLAVLCVLPGPEGDRNDGSEIFAVLADDARGTLGFFRTPVPDGRSYPALSAEMPQAQAFEREIAEDHGIRPEGHPWLKPLRRHRDLEARADGGQGAEDHPFFRVEGSGIHEVAVGPVHAGIIEPGHFRFQCHGENVHHLEIQLGYQHRGAQELLLRSSPARRLAVAESIAGDTAVGHALAHCQAIEALAAVEPPLSAHAVRGIALELERLSNHVGDLGALCNDVGFLPGASWFGRLRGEFLNLLLDLSGNRFGRGLLVPGGVRFGLSSQQRTDFLARLRRAERDLRDVAQTTFDSPSVGSRFEHTGVVTREVAEDLGLVGPVARASGCDRDVRRDHPFGIFRFAHIPVARVDSGDVMSRALVRWLEIQRSLTFLREQLQELAPESVGGPSSGPGRSGISEPALSPESIAVSMVEGWRGEIAHVAATSSDGRLAAYEIVDPSFHNWFGLTMALRGGQISDFPLCNKSFNLSYAGHDQ